MMEWHLLRPELLWLLLPLAGLWALLLRKQRQQGRWHQLLDPVLAPYLVEGFERPRGRGRLTLLALAWLLAVLALAGPSLERQPQPVGQGMMRWCWCWIFPCPCMPRTCPLPASFAPA